MGTLTAFLWSLYALFLGTAGTPGMKHGFEFTIAPSDGAANIYLEVGAGVTVFILAGRYFEKRSKRQAGAALRALLELGVKDVAGMARGAPGRVPPTGPPGSGRVGVPPGGRDAPRCARRTGSRRAPGAPGPGCAPAAPAAGGALAKPTPARTASAPSASADRRKVLSSAATVPV